MKAHREAVRDIPIRRDPSLEACERETSMNLTSEQDVIAVQSYQPTFIRGLLRQPEFEVAEYVTKTIRGQEFIVGISGKLPVACLHIGAARKRGSLSAAFSRRSNLRPQSCVLQTQTDGAAAMDSTTASNHPAPTRQPK